uniref:Uncharacterized protein n=1 Tax=Trepomonas sp. PC1 TaxID=1076344 RepID=A0A146JYB9_9EUKA|eukprot:JAP89693.1 Hypothetical protein TPC1_30812 [Trepomonas sp. PC1]
MPAVRENAAFGQIREDLKCFESKVREGRARGVKHALEERTVLQRKGAEVQRGQGNLLGGKRKQKSKKASWNEAARVESEHALKFSQVSESKQIRENGADLIDIVNKCSFHIIDLLCLGVSQFKVQPTISSITARPMVTKATTEMAASNHWAQKSLLKQGKQKQPSTIIRAGLRNGWVAMLKQSSVLFQNGAIAKATLDTAKQRLIAKVDTQQVLLKPQLMKARAAQTRRVIAESTYSTFIYVSQSWMENEN